MNIDIVLESLIHPIPNCLILVVCIFWGARSKCVLLYIACYAILQAFCWLNTWFKCRGDRPWTSLKEIENPTVLITGGSSGLGRSVILELLSRYRDVRILNIDLVHFPADDSRVTNYKCDLRNADERNRVIRKIRSDSHGVVHLIVNNAGMRSTFHDCRNVEDSELNAVLALNYLTPMKIMQEIIPQENGAQQCYMVNIASTLGILSPRRVSPYASSKAALIAFHKSYSFELETKAVSNIRTLLVIPGQLDTSMFAGFEPPRQFFAPVVKTDSLARTIVDHAEAGQRGDLCVPFYSNLAHVLMALPYMVQILTRKFSKMDDCLPED